MQSFERSCFCLMVSEKTPTLIFFQMKLCELSPFNMCPRWKKQQQQQKPGILMIYMTYLTILVPTKFEP